jgi:hypothetical protein
MLNQTVVMSTVYLSTAWTTETAVVLNTDQIRRETIRLQSSHCTGQLRHEPYDRTRSGESVRFDVIQNFNCLRTGLHNTVTPAVHNTTVQNTPLRLRRSRPYGAASPRATKEMVPSITALCLTGDASTSCLGLVVWDLTRKTSIHV